MCILFRFSKYVLLAILSESLSCKDFLLLDSSLTNCHERKIFLDLIADHCHLFQKRFLKIIRFGQYTPLIIDYARARQFKFDDMHFVISEKWIKGPGLGLSPTERNKACLNEIKSLNILGKGTNAVSSPMELFPNLVTLVTSDFLRFDLVGQYCRNLQSLDVTSRNKETLRLDEVFRHCRHLTHFGWCHWGSADFANVIQAMVVHGSELTSLKISSSQIGQYCIMLIALHNSRNKLSKIIVEFTNNRELNALLWYRGSKLLSFRTDKFYFGGRRRLALVGVQGIGIACPLLTDISLFSFAEIEDDAMIELLQSLPNLKVLSGSLEYTSPAVIQAYANCQSLTQLNFPPMWKVQEVENVEFKWFNLIELQAFCCDSVPYILRHCTQLRDLTLFPGVSLGHGIIPPKLFDIVKELPTIQILDIARLVNWITLDLLKEVYSRCPALKDLYCGTFEGRDQFKVLVGSRFNVWRFRVKDVHSQEKTIK